MKNDRLSAALARELFNYSSETGKIFWAPRDRRHFKSDVNFKTFNSHVAGTETGLSKDSSGYFVVRVMGTTILVHRLVWAVHYGSWPDGALDHINRERTDNRICNLRILSHAENCINRSRRSDNSSGITGIHYAARQGKWVAAIMKGGKWTHLGYFHDKESAVCARKEAEERLYGHIIQVPVYRVNGRKQ